MERSMPEGRTETLMERSMPEGRTFYRFHKHTKTSSAWHLSRPGYPSYAQMVQEAFLSSPPSSYWLRGGLPSINHECISKYISSKYPLVEEKHHLDRKVLIRQAILKLCGEGVVLWDSVNGRYSILPQFSTGSAASFSSWNIIHPPPPNYYQQPPPSPPLSPPQPPQPMEEDTAEERHLALVPVDIKCFILLPTGRNSKIPSDPPPPYPPPLWEV